MPRDWGGVKPTFRVSTGTIFKIADGIAKKELTPSSLSYKQWRSMPKEIKQRSMFSAKLFQAEHLSDIKKKLVENLEGKRIQVRDSATGRKYWESRGMLDQINPATGIKYGDEYILQSRSLITRDLIDLARERAIRPTGFKYPEEWQGHPSRVDVIFSYNIEHATNVANYNAGQDPDILNYFVGYEFGRLSEVAEPRDWETLWQEAGDRCNWAGASKAPKIALKDSPIWAELNQISPGNPLPPYAFNSRMGFFREVSRGECEQLGIIAKGQKLQPKPIDLNAKTMVDISDLDPFTLKQIEGELGDKISKVKGKTFWSA